MTTFIQVSENEVVQLGSIIRAKYFPAIFDEIYDDGETIYPRASILSLTVTEVALETKHGYEGEVESFAATSANIKLRGQLADSAWRVIKSRVYSLDQAEIEAPF